MPMQAARCNAPGCNATIGGENHRSAAGNTRVGLGFDTAPRRAGAALGGFRGYRAEEAEHYEVMARG